MAARVRITDLVNFMVLGLIERVYKDNSSTCGTIGIRKMRPTLTNVSRLGGLTILDNPQLFKNGQACVMLLQPLIQTNADDLPSPGRKCIIHFFVKN